MTSPNTMACASFTSSLRVSVGSSRGLFILGCDIVQDAGKQLQNALGMVGIIRRHLLRYSVVDRALCVTTATDNYDRRNDTYSYIKERMKIWPIAAPNQKDKIA